MSRLDRFSRRTLLKGLGVGPALLPMLEIEHAFAAPCAGVSGPRRAFIMVWPNGMISKTGSTWATAGEGANFTIPPFMSSLEPYRSDLLLLDGLNYDFVADSPNPNRGEVSGHACFQGMLTGKHYQSFGSGTASNVGGGISIDQYVGNALKAKGYTGIPSLNLQSWSRSTARLSWSGAGQAVIPEFDPFRVFNVILAGKLNPPATTPTTPNPMPTTPVVDKNILMRRSILDGVIKDFNRFAVTVGTADRARIDQHLTFCRDIELQLRNAATGGGAGAGTVAPPAGSACQRPTFPAAITGDALKTATNFPKVTQLHIDLSVAAFAADATRFVVLQLGDQGNPDVILHDIGFTAGGQDGNTGNINAHHSIAHRNGAEKVKVDEWFMKQAAYAIGKLKEVTQADNTSLLDQSIFLAMNNMRTGIHEFRGVPAIIAGKCGDYFKTGRSLKLTNVRNNQVLVGIANAMLGTQLTSFGQTEYGGEFAGFKG